MAWEPDYVTADELAAHLRVEDTDDDTVYGLAVTTASRAIDRETNRQFGLIDNPAARTYTARPDYSGHGYWVADIDDVMTTTGLAVDIDGTAVTGYELGPRNAAADGRPWRTLSLTGDAEAWPDAHPHLLTVTARWGWTAYPDAVRQATLLQASRLVKRRDAPFGVAGSPDQGSELRLLAKVDPDVAVSLRPYRRARLPA